MCLKCVLQPWYCFWFSHRLIGGVWSGPAPLHGHGSVWTIQAVLLPISWTVPGIPFWKKSVLWYYEPSTTKMTGQRINMSPIKHTYSERCSDQDLKGKVNSLKFPHKEGKSCLFKVNCFLVLPKGSRCRCSLWAF